MSKVFSNIVLQMILCVAAMIGIFVVKSAVTGTPMNVPMMLVLLGSAVIGLLIAHTSRRK